MSAPAPQIAELRSMIQAHVDPLVGQSLGEADAVRSVELRGERVAVAIELGFPAGGYRDALAGALATAIRGQCGLDADVDVTWAVRPHAVQKNLKPLDGIRNIIAVASGKGGVGKSTVTANLALALQAEGAKVGVLDADIYGPSQPQMLGASGLPDSPDRKRLQPMMAHGLQTMSIGYLVDASQPMIWRGPMVTQALSQLLGDTIWDDLDYLVVDLPPGTGDIQLSLAQRIPVSGAIIVTTPQDIALLDARKGLEMFRKVEVTVLGVVENMATHTCSNCGHEEAVFGSGGGERLAADTGVELLGRLPLEMRIREQVDSGRPTVAAEPDSDVASRFRDIARRAAARLAYGPAGAAFPTIEVTDD